MGFNLIAKCHALDPPAVPASAANDESNLAKFFQNDDAVAARDLLKFQGKKISMYTAKHIISVMEASKNDCHTVSSPKDIVQGAVIRQNLQVTGIDVYFSLLVVLLSSYITLLY